MSIMRMRSTSRPWLISKTGGSLARTPAYAWGDEGPGVITAITPRPLTPAVTVRVDAILATAPDTLTKPDMISRPVCADPCHSASHRETANWHLVEYEIDQEDFKVACFGKPQPDRPASAKSTHDCVVDNVEEFAIESFGFAKNVACASSSPAGRASVPIPILIHFPAGCERKAMAFAAVQSEQDRARLAVLVNGALGTTPG